MEGVWKEPVLVKNEYGIEIKTCCASCEHSSIDDSLVRTINEKDRMRRHCSRHGGTVLNCDCCDMWEMKKFWRTFNVKNTGQVKSKEWLDKWAKTMHGYRDKMKKAKETGDRLLERKLRDELEEFKEKKATLWES